MSSPEPKLFKRQSQQMRAVRTEATHLVEELTAFLERANTEPPPVYVDNEYQEYGKSA